MTRRESNKHRRSFRNEQIFEKWLNERWMRRYGVTFEAFKASADAGEIEGIQPLILEDATGSSGE